MALKAVAPQGERVCVLAGATRGCALVYVNDALVLSTAKMGDERKPEEEELLC